jgi:hypothetical protein
MFRAQIPAVTRSVDFNERCTYAALIIHCIVESMLTLPCLQSQKFWQEMLAGQAKNPLARLQFTDGCGSSAEELGNSSSFIPP